MLSIIPGMAYNLSGVEKPSVFSGICIKFQTLNADKIKVCDFLDFEFLPLGEDDESFSDYSSL